MRCALAAAVLGGLMVAAAAGQTDDRPAAGELARALQTRYAAVRDFRATFTHTYRGGVLRKTVVEQGTVLVKKPGKMRWTYIRPEEKVFVSDGDRIYAYIPADRQVQISSMPSEDEATTAVLFLTGKGDLARDFEASYGDEPAQTPGAYALKLVPHRDTADYDWLILEVDRESLAIRSLVAADQQGGTSRFALTDLQENVGLSDKEFAFRIPRGVDVIHRDRSS